MENASSSRLMSQEEDPTALFFSYGMRGLAASVLPVLSALLAVFPATVYWGVRGLVVSALFLFVGDVVGHLALGDGVGPR